MWVNQHVLFKYKSLEEFGHSKVTKNSPSKLCLGTILKDKGQTSNLITC